MATITAALIKELRERTGVGMMDCKRALGEADGDIETAISNLRKAGAAAAAKKAGRIAAEGVIASAQSAQGDVVALLEVNSETDFVAKDEGFTNFSNTVAQVVVDANPKDVDALNAASFDKGTVEEARQALITKIGENLSVRRFERLTSNDENLGVYLHGSKIGVMVKLQGGSTNVAKDVAMHVAASNPRCISANQMPSEVLAAEKEIFVAQARESGKPDNIIEKMIEGRMAKFLKENTLLGQPFVKNPDQTIAQFLKENNASISNFVRLEVGEGLEKKQDDFVAEVMAQTK